MHSMVVHIHILDRRVDDLRMSSLVCAISIVASIVQSVERGPREPKDEG